MEPFNSILQLLIPVFIIFGSDGVLISEGESGTSSIVELGPERETIKLMNKLW